MASLVRYAASLVAFSTRMTRNSLAVLVGVMVLDYMHLSGAVMRHRYRQLYNRDHVPFHRQMLDYVHRLTAPP